MKLCELNKLQIDAKKKKIKTTFPINQQRFPASSNLLTRRGSRDRHITADNYHHDSYKPRKHFTRFRGRGKITNILHRVTRVNSFGWKSMAIFSVTCSISGVPKHVLSSPLCLHRQRHLLADHLVDSLRNISQFQHVHLLLLRKVGVREGTDLD